MTTQPEALRLADALELPIHESAYYRQPAAAELRRLHAVNEELLKALSKCSAQLTRLGYSANHADQAIAKTTGETK